LAYFGEDDNTDNDDDITADLPLNCYLQDNISGGDRSLPCQPDDEFGRVISIHHVLYSMKDRFSCGDDSLLDLSAKEDEEQHPNFLKGAGSEIPERHSAMDDSPGALDIGTPTHSKKRGSYFFIN